MELTKQKKIYLEDLQKRFRMALETEEYKYPDVKITSVDIIKILEDLLLEEISEGKKEI